MKALIIAVKETMGYMQQARNCGNCRSFKEDMTTDNFGGGDTCWRNPDIPFSTEKSACCDKWKITIEEK